MSTEDWRLDSSSTFRGTPWVLWGWGERLLTGQGERGIESDPRPEACQLLPPCSPRASHLDVLHQLWLLQEQERALGALEDAHLGLAGILVKVLLNVPLLVEDHFAGALIHEPVRQAPGRDVAKAPRAESHGPHPISTLSEPGSDLGKHYPEPTRILPSLKMSLVHSRQLCH